MHIINQKKLFQLKKKKKNLELFIATIKTYCPNIH